MKVCPKTITKDIRAVQIMFKDESGLWEVLNNEWCAIPIYSYKL